MNKQSDSTAAVYEAVFHSTESCYHFPELKKLVSLCMTEFAALESAKEAQLFAEWKEENDWKFKEIDREVFYYGHSHNDVSSYWKTLEELYQLYKEGKG